MEFNIEKLKNNLDKRLKDDISSGRIGGAAFSVMKDKEIVYENSLCAPYMNFSIDENTLYRLASMTKPITAIAIMQLKEKGLLSIDDEIKKYFPAFSKMHLGKFDDQGVLIKCGEVKTPIKIMHLLTHTSGLGSGPLGNAQVTNAVRGSFKTLSDALLCYPSLLMEFEPFKDTNYSASVAFDILARIVEIISGTTFYDYIKENILYPLGMSDTAYDYKEDDYKRLIPMHTMENGSGKIADFSHKALFATNQHTYHCGGAGLGATIGDYIKLTNMFLDAINGKKTILSKSSVDDMRTGRFKRTDYEDWGLGMRVISAENEFLPIGSFGWSGAYGPHFWVDPKNQVTAVYMKNSLFDGGSEAISSRNFEKDVYSALF